MIFFGGGIFFLGGGGYFFIYFFFGGGGIFVQYSMVLYSTVQYNAVITAVQYSTEQYSTVLYCTVQYNTQYCTVQYTQTGRLCIQKFEVYRRRRRRRRRRKSPSEDPRFHLQGLWGGGSRLAQTAWSTFYG